MNEDSPMVKQFLSAASRIGLSDTRNVLVKSIIDIGPAAKEKPPFPIRKSRTTFKRHCKEVALWKKECALIDHNNDLLSLTPTEPNTRVTFIAKRDSGYKGEYTVDYIRPTIRQLLEKSLPSPLDEFVITIPKRSKAHDIGLDDKDRLDILKRTVSKKINIPVSEFDLGIFDGVKIGHWNSLKKVQIWAAFGVSLTYYPDPRPVTIKVIVKKEGDV